MKADSSGSLTGACVHAARCRFAAPRPLRLREASIGWLTSSGAHAPQISPAGGHEVRPYLLNGGGSRFGGFTKTYGFRTSGHQRPTASRAPRSPPHRPTTPRTRDVAAPWARGFMASSLRWYAASWVCRLEAPQLWSVTASRHHGFAAPQLRSTAISRIRGITPSHHNGFASSQHQRLRIVTASTASRHHGFVASHLGNIPAS